MRPTSRGQHGAGWTLARRFTLAVRMKDIAEDLNVSLMTVSKALRNHADVAEETRRRVCQHARELGYEPNLVACSLAGHLAS